jgi:hypothetical protein
MSKDRRRGLQRIVAANLVLAATLALPGLATATESGVADGSGPLLEASTGVVICGQRIWPGGYPPWVELFEQPGRFRALDKLHAQSSLHPLPVVMLFTSSCRTGVHLRLKPNGRLTVYSVAHTADHGVAAITVFSRHPGIAQVIVTRRGVPRTLITIKVAPELGLRVLDDNQVET